MRKTQKTNFASAVSARYPGLIGKIKRLIEESEKEYAKSPGTEDSYLWEHTSCVASLGYQLAQAEKRDPLLPSIAALFHDAGKFSGGRYHQDDTAEEKDAARLAGNILREAGMRNGDINRVTSGLLALYDAKARKNWVTNIVHDADFLSKFGTLGVANFFIKATLRRKTLLGAILNYLSKELTYAACLPSNMRTQAGKQLARKKSKDTLKFFRALLRELKETQAADFTIKRLSVKPPSGRRQPIEVHLAVPRSCEKCGGSWKLSFNTEKEIKCEKLEAEMTCSGCGSRSSFSFCLPEIG